MADPTIFIIIFAAIIVIGIISASIERNKTAKKTEEIRIRENSPQRKLLFQKIIENNALPIIDYKNINIVLKKDEVLHIADLATLIEERSIRNYKSNSYGYNYSGYSTGTSTGQSESHGELRKIDSGNLILTNKRLFFNGDLKNITIPLSKIVSIERPFIDSFEVGVEGKQKVQVFSVSDPQMWNIFIKIAIEKSK